MITISSCEFIGFGKSGRDIELVGVTWKLSTFEKEGVKTNKGCADITLVFTEEGDVSGDSERNRYVGLFETDFVDVISIRGKPGPYLMTTLVGESSCSRYVEHLFTLVKAQSYAIDGKQLEIRCTDGIVLHYETEYLKAQ